MGIVKALFDSVKGGLADTWLEVIEANNMSDTTVFTKGVTVRKNDKRNNNRKGTEDIISNGSIIHVYDNQFMMLVDGGKVVDFSAEPGYYKVDNSAMPSLFAGQFGKSLAETFGRIRYGGVPSQKQQVFYVNLQEIKGIKFGTPSPVNYFDNFYNAELFLRAHGSYSIKVTDPLKFYAEVIPRNATYVDINQINEQYRSEFLEALQAAINQMSADNIRISQVVSKTRELSQYMSTELDKSWNEMRGFEVQAVGIASVSYDDESKKLINMRNQGAMLGDPTVREGYMQGAVARGIEAAGSNANGTMNTFMGMGVGMGMAGGAMGGFSETNRAAMQQQQQQRQAAEAAAKAADSWKCACGAVNTGKFCTECGAKKPEAPGAWKCPKCGAENAGKFCTECGAKKPEDDGWFCPECGAKNTGKFCTECGHKKD